MTRDHHKIIALLAVCAMILTACQPTPDDGLVKSKNDDAFMDALASPRSTQAGVTVVPQTAATAAANRFAGYTETWKETDEVKPYPITVHIDADVVTPVADALPVYAVTPQRIDQEQVDGFLSQFPDAVFRLNMDEIRAKSEYEEMILDNQEQLAKLNQRDDLTAEQIAQQRDELERSIQWLIQDMQSVPESVDDIVDPIFSDQYIIACDSQPEHFIDEDGNEELPPEGGRTAREEYGSTHTQAVNIRWEWDDCQMTLDAIRSDRLFNNTFSFLAGPLKAGPAAGDTAAILRMASMSANTVGNAGNLDGLATTYEQAEAMAAKALSLLGVDYMALACSAKNIEYGDLKNLNYTDSSFYTDFDSLEYTDKAYVFYYTRTVGGVKETYCSNGMMCRDQYDEPWPYERLTVVVDDSGVREIKWDSCGSGLGEMVSEDCDLLTFDEVMTIAAQQIGIGNLDFEGTVFSEAIFQYLVNMELMIDSIELGYSRVKLSDGSGRYVLVPVWDFFGSFAGTQNMGKNERNFYSKEIDSVPTYRHSFLTINAIDGSVIDRGVGY